MFQFLTHVELSRLMVAILEMPQYVAYQKNVVYAFIKLSAKSHSFNSLRTMGGLSCPTNKPAPKWTKESKYEVKNNRFLQIILKNCYKA